MRRISTWAPVWALTACGLVAAGAAHAATTGRLAGRVTDDGGAALPGVTVTTTSPAQIGGEQTTQTDGDGLFQFPRLAPGVYTVDLALDGFIPQRRTEVPVRLDGTTELLVTMAASTFGEEVVVTADTPVVDTEQTSITQTYSGEYLQNTAVGSTNRSYQGVFDKAAGVTSSGGNAIVFGSTDAENAYMIDGIDTTDPVTATFGTNFNFDAIAEIAFHTAGFKAEYGRATGGFVNLVTKSGGNEYSGTADVRYRDTDYTEEGEHFDRTTSRNEQLDAAFTLGGPILRDRLWFFVSDEEFEAERTDNNEPLPTDITAASRFAKLTWQPADGWSMVGKWSEDPAEFDDVFRAPNDAIETAYLQEQGGEVAQADLAAVLSADLIWELKGARNRQMLDVTPSGGIDTPAIFDFDTSSLSNNYLNAQFSERDRDELSSSLTYFVDDLAGSHELKAGVEHSDLFFRSDNFTTGELIYYDRSSIIGPYYFTVSPRAAPAEFDGEVMGGYLQDDWRITPRLTASIGVRYDEASFDNDAGTEVATLDKVQPRLGLAWDATGDGKTVVRASAGRFMHPNALSLPQFARASAGAPSERYVSCSLVGATSPEICQAAFGLESWRTDPLGRDPNGWFFFDTLASEPNVIDPNLRAMYAEHLVLGVERELFRRTSVELSFVKKETEDIFEDTCDGNFPVVGASESCDFYVMANLPQLTREYEGAILAFETNPNANLHLRASYTWSRSQGSILDTQNGGTDFDVFPVHFDNRYGYLSDDRRNRVKLTGFYRLPWDVLLGFDGFWSDKFAYDRTANVTPYGIEFLEPRGSRRANTNYQIDLQVSKSFRFGDGWSLQPVVAIFNALDSERPTAVCENDTGCGASAPNLGDPLSYQRPRGYEVGLRFEF